MITLSDTERVKVEQAIEEVGPDPFDVIEEDYRGRGEEQLCFGVKFDDASQVEQFFVELAIINGDLAQALVSSCRHDSMGKRTLTYFPGYTLP